MKKSSVENTNPFSPASALALVDFPDPGRPRMRISVLVGLSAYIIFFYYKRTYLIMRASRIYFNLTNTAKLYFNNKQKHKSVLICPDKFKFSLTAIQVAQCIANQIPCSVYTKIITLADGGEGSLDRISQEVQGQWIDCQVNDPLFRRIKASYFCSDLNQAYIEMAAASGLSLLAPAERNPMKTTSFGTGQLILNSLRRGHTTVHLLIGGSATNDAGIGMAAALGYQFSNRNNQILSPIGQNLIHIQNIQQTDPQIRLLLEKTNILVYTDVTNPLTRKQGASHIYGPQKGATLQMAQALDEGVDNLNKLFIRKYGINVDQVKGSGAAGGLGGGSLIFLKSKLLRGIDLIFNLTQFEQYLKKSDLVITGEGKVDGQTLQGKVVNGVIQRAAKYNKKVIVVCAYAEGVQQFKRQYPQVELVQLLHQSQKSQINPKLTRQRLCDFVRKYFQ